MSDDGNRGEIAGEKPDRGPGGRFALGNPGRPKGTRHKATLAAEMLLDGEAEALTRVAIDAGLAGEPTALRLCLERILPARKSRPVRFEMPPLKTAADGPIAISAISEAAAAGDLSIDEAEGFLRIVDAFIRAFEVGELEVRLRAVELATSR